MEDNRIRGAIDRRPLRGPANRIAWLLSIGGRYAARANRIACVAIDRRPLRGPANRIAWLLSSGGRYAARQTG